MREGILAIHIEYLLVCVFIRTCVFVYTNSVYATQSRETFVCHIEYLLLCVFIRMCLHENVSKQVNFKHL